MQVIPKDPHSISSSSIQGYFSAKCFFVNNTTWAPCSLKQNKPYSHVQHHNVRLALYWLAEEMKDKPGEAGHGLLLLWLNTPIKYRHYKPCKNTLSKFHKQHLPTLKLSFQRIVTNILCDNCATMGKKKYPHLKTECVEVKTKPTAIFISILKIIFNHLTRAKKKNNETGLSGDPRYWINYSNCICTSDIQVHIQPGQMSMQKRSPHPENAVKESFTCADPYCRTWLEDVYLKQKLWGCWGQRSSVMWLVPKGSDFTSKTDLELSG